MSCFAVSPVMSATVKRSLAFAGLLTAVVLAAPPALAQATPDASAHQTRASRRAETVEQRIAALHTALKITAAEDPAWEAVAQTMRDNAAAMSKLTSDTTARARQGMTAIEDMQSYQQLAQANVDEMKSLLAAFSTLYDAMPEEQKKLADQVFRDARRHGMREAD
jgi:protein CpxP